MIPSKNSALQLFLNRLSGRSQLSEEEKQAILGLPGQPTQVRANRDFVRLGEKVTHACLIVDGMVGRFGQNANGERQITAIHIPGDMVDLHSVVRPQAGSALQALTTTTLIQIPHSAVLEVAHKYPKLAEAFWRDCVLDAAILSQWVVNVGRRNALCRTAHLLCEMARRHEQIGNSAPMDYPFPVTQSQLGDALGLTAVHVNRTLRALKQTGAVEFSQGRVRISDWKKLTDIGDFDAAYLDLGQDAGRRERLVA